MIKNLIIAILLVNSAYLTYKVVDDYILQYQLRKAFDEVNAGYEGYLRTSGRHINSSYTCRLKK